MANFVNDYSNLAAAGAGFQSFAEAYERAQDSQMKRQEMQARMESEKTKAQREADQTAITAKIAGLRKSPDGSFEDAPVSPRGRIDEDIKAGGEGFNVKRDDTGTYQGLEVNPNSPKMVGARNQGLRMQSGNDYKQEGLDLRRDVVDRREHEKVLGRINSNANVKTRLQQYQNLDNTLSNIANADHITPEMFDEAQQAIRANLGIKGGSGVGERELTQMKSVGLNVDRMKQFLTGMPSDVGQQNQFLAHIKNLAQLEKQNISQQFDKSLKASSGGHASMYSRRPDLMEDLKDALEAQKGQLDPGMQAPAQQAPPQGMLEKKQGMLSGLIGSVFGSQADAAPKPDPQIDAWAKAHGMPYESAAKIISERLSKQNGK